VHAGDIAETTSEMGTRWMGIVKDNASGTVKWWLMHKNVPRVLGVSQ